MSDTAGVTGGLLPNAGPRAVHAWDRFDGMWAAVFYVTLGIPTVSSMVDADAGAGRRLSVVAAVAAMAGARELAVRRVAREVTGGSSIGFAPGARDHVLVGLAWALATVAGLVVLVRADPIFFFALYGLFPQSFVVLPRNWAIAFAGVLVPTMLVAEEGMEAFDGDFVTSAVGSGLVALVLGVFIHGISRESEDRHDAIVALEAAQAEAESLQRQLVEAARTTGVAEERARLAREIHDTLAQGFVSVLTQLEAVDDGSSSGMPDQVAERLSRARSIARSSLGEARRSVQALRPVELEAAPLPEAVERVARRWSFDSGVATAVTITGAVVALPPATEVTLLRAVQETLANVARHAQAASVNVTLSFLDDPGPGGSPAGGEVVLDVHDDGRGFCPSPQDGDDGSGFGLVALRQRVVTAGGAVGIESEAGAGTTVTVRLPLAGIPSGGRAASGTGTGTPSAVGTEDRP